MYQVIFICTGNTCRSPMAEYLLRELAEEQGLDLSVTSAGLAAQTGGAISRGTEEVLLQLGDDERVRGFTQSHRSKPLTRAMIDEADELLTMTEDQRAYLLAQYPEAEGKVHALGSFRRGVPEPWSSQRDVVDPYGGPVEYYEETYAQLKVLIQAWVDQRLSEGQDRE